VVIAAHSPEFNYEKEVDKVKAYVKENNILYAVPFDTEFRNGTANSRIPVILADPLERLSR